MVWIFAWIIASGPAADPGGEMVLRMPPYDLDAIRDDVRAWYRGLAAPGKPYGAYRLRPDKPADLYASADIVWIRWMMQDLDLSETERKEWIGFIQDQQEPADGSYRHITSHCKTHAFCHATGALKMLGAEHRHAPLLLEPYRRIEGIPAWLDGIDWNRQWGASHDIWGAGLPIACSRETPDAWRETFFAWLDREVDPATGFWRKAREARSALERLGGAFHIWPIYAALDRPIPYPERVIDGVLALVRADGSFDGAWNYGNMDGVWILAHLLRAGTAHRREDVIAALDRNLRGSMRLLDEEPERFLADAHGTESRIATIAIIQTALPDRFRTTAPWRDPWAVRELFAIGLPAGEATAGPLPRLIDFGGSDCTPCAMMQPVLEDLRREFAGRLRVDFINTWEDLEVGERYGVMIIPAQIFYDADGKEVFRHEGFYSKAEIVAKWKELGVDLGGSGADPDAGILHRLFAGLSRAVEGAPAVALLAAFAWGILSIVLSPCHLASIPLIVAFIDRQGRMGTRRALWISTLFASGILITIAAVGAVTAAAGRLLGDVGPFGAIFVAAIFFVVGLHLLDIIPAPWSGPGQVGMRRRGPVAAFILGLVFGIALGPCTFAYMAPMLGVTFRVAAASMGYGILLLAAYGLGHSSVIVAAGTFTGEVQRYLDWNERSRAAIILRRACGVLIILAGVFLVENAL